MTRDEARKLMESKITNINLRKHILAVEAVMKFLARELKADEEEWGMAGLLHDLDYEETKNSPERHGLVTAEWLTGKGINDAIINAIKAHAEKKPRETPMEKAIYCADPITGFLVACALIKPEKKLSAVDADFAKNRMKEKRFAAGANRNAIMASSELGMELDKFINISLDAMKSINAELGL
ncbi:MAG: HDIG domain-containing protein [Planctomycetes bacterium]|nr:HDIG domain-containing protein [Planctomycetota bacterium]